MVTFLQTFISDFIPLGQAWDFSGFIPLPMVVIIFFMIAILKNVTGMVCNSSNNRVVKMKIGVSKLETFLKSG